MSLPSHPRLRQVESFPVPQADGPPLFALRDPHGFATPIALPRPAAVLASLMDGQRSIAQIQEDFARIAGESVTSDELNGLVSELEHRLFLDSDRYRAHWKKEVETYLNSPLRPASHAGTAYAAQPDALREQLHETFISPYGPGVPRDVASETAAVTAGGNTSELCAVLSPHIDVRCGGPWFAWAYKKLVEESQADLFIILGTAHSPMNQLFSVSRKHFETPLGTVETDKKFVGRLQAKLNASAAGKELNLGADELAHRNEHSLEFQAIYLQYLLGERRKFTVVPVLVGSFHKFVREKTQPADSPIFQAFVAAMRQCITEFAGRVMLICSADLAHIGLRFGDRELLDRQRLEQQSDDDRELLATAVRCDAAAFFDHVAAEGDRSRICGLSPTYALLEILKPKRGELLKYGQAVEQDATSCVSFASMAFYGSSL